MTQHKSAHTYIYIHIYLKQDACLHQPDMLRLGVLEELRVAQLHQLGGSVASRLHFCLYVIGQLSII